VEGYQNMSAQWRELSGCYAPFPGTVWTMIHEAQHLPHDQRGELLAVILEAYRRPIYAYYRAHNVPHQDAEDLVSGLNFKFINMPQIIDPVTRQNGRFRSWLLVIAHNMMVDYFASLQRMPKPDMKRINLDDVEISEAGKQLSGIFNIQWRKEVLRCAFEMVYAQCEQKYRMVDLEIFCDYYVEHEGKRTTWQEIADKYGLPSWKRAARKADWVKKQLAKSIRTEIRRYLDDEDDVDEELRDLLG
jgi:RNA polymerase sigma factor (sigma-70 family)